MSQRRSFSFLILCVFLLAALVGCNTPNVTPSSGSSSQPVTAVSSPPSTASISLIDSAEREVVLQSYPEKLIALTPSAVEIIFALGQQDRLLAIGDYCNYPQETEQMTKLGTGSKLNLEEIIALQPDCVVIGTMATQEQQVARLSEAGIACVVVQAGDIVSTYENILLLGKLTAAEAQAEELVHSMQAEFASLRRQAEDLPEVTVYLEIAPLPSIWTCGENTFQNELLSVVGARNIFADIDLWQQVSEEEIISRNPEVIITTVSSYEGYEEPLKEVMSRANWQQIAAMQADRVYAFDPDTIARPGPRLVQAAQELFELIHGDAPIIP